MTRSTTYDTRIAKALSHPTRVKAMEILNARVASPSDIARELDLPVATVSYHVKTLLQLQCIEEVGTQHVRGSIEHFYRATRRSHVPLPEWEAMPASARHEHAARVAENAFAALREAFASDAFAQRTDTHTSWTRLTLDEQGWERVYGVLHDALDAVLEEEAASAARLAESGEQGIRSSVAMFQHPIPPGFTTAD